MENLLLDSIVARDKFGEDALPEELQTLEKQVIKFFESKNMNIQSVTQNRVTEASLEVEGYRGVSE